MRRFQLLLLLLCYYFVVVLCPLLSESSSSSLVLGNDLSSSDAREFLLSDDFFDSYYGIESDLLLSFENVPNTLEAPFHKRPELWRVYLDLPFQIDCSFYSTFELIAEVENLEALGSMYLYLHSGDGWYSIPGMAKRLPNGRLTVLYELKNANREGNPSGLDEVDMVRLSFNQGASVDGVISFRSLKGARGFFAVLDGYESADASFIASTASIFNRSGLLCERLDVSRSGLKTLLKYKGIVLPVGGNLADEVVDTLCEYVDAGGFVFAFYTAPERLLAKIGVESRRFVSCRSAGYQIEGMEFTEDSIASAREREFVFPTFIEQSSWNFIEIDVAKDYCSPRESVIFGDRKAHVLATWRMVGESDPNEKFFPALTLSGSGMYCSHVFLLEGMDSRRQLLASVGAALDPRSMCHVAHKTWTSCFTIGVEPDSNVFDRRVETLERLEKELLKRGWTLKDVCEILCPSDSAPDRCMTVRLDAILRDIRKELTLEYCASCPSRIGEGRLWWEHSGCGIWPGDWDRTMKTLSEAGFNGIIPNLLWGGSAYYPSDVLPESEIVAKYGDQLSQAVAAGKKYGVEVHAWMVCFNASNSSQDFLSKMRAEGRLQVTSSGEVKPWLCPSHPTNRELQRRALEEVAFNYDVDGIHFDYIRYPDGDTCFCEGCRERFVAAYHKVTGKSLDGDLVILLQMDKDVREAWENWRVEQITTLVKEVSESLRSCRPDVQISAAVFPDDLTSKRTIGQDWTDWAEKGYLDFVCPMDYTSDSSAFQSYVKKQTPKAKGKCLIYPGIGMTATGIQLSADEVVLQTQLASESGGDGFVIFNLTESSATTALPALKLGVTSVPTSRARASKN